VLAPLASAEVLRSPSDALVVVKVNKLKAVSDKIAHGQKLGSPRFNGAGDRSAR